MQHGAFAVRRVDLLAGLELDLADRQHVLRALVEQLDDLRVQLVDRLAVFGNVHARWPANWGSLCRRPELALPRGGSRRRAALRLGWPPSELSSGGAVARPGSAVSSASGFCDRDAAQLIGGGQFFQAAQAEIFEEQRRGAVSHRPADDFRARRPARPVRVRRKRLHDAIHRDAADLLDFRAGDRLAISDDGQRFQRRLRESAAAGHFCRPSALSQGANSGWRDELPATGHANQPIAAAAACMFLFQLLQRGDDVLDVGLLESLDGLRIVASHAALRRARRAVLSAHRLLGGEQNRFQNKF